MSLHSTYEPHPYVLHQHGNVIKIRNGIMFDFYPGLPHVSILSASVIVIGLLILEYTSGI